MLGSRVMENRLSRPKIAVLLWASLWMLAVPLFHIHPRVDHRHGGVEHTHGVAVHTVLSSDFDTEFDDHHDGDVQEEASSEVALVDHHSHSMSDHPEVGFILLNDASDRKVAKAFLTQPILIDATLVSDPHLHTWTEPELRPIRGSTIIVHELRPRAPPVLLS